MPDQVNVLLGNKLLFTDFIDHLLILFYDSFHNNFPRPISQTESFYVIFAEPLERNCIEVGISSLGVRESIFLPFRVWVSLPNIRIVDSSNFPSRSIECLRHLVKINKTLAIDSEEVRTHVGTIEFVKIYVVEYAKDIILVDPVLIFVLVLPNFAETFHCLKTFS